MKDRMDDFERELRAFRPQGELEQVETLLERIHGQAAADPFLRAQLRVSPQAVLAQFGLPLSPNATIQVHQNTPGIMHVVLYVHPDIPTEAPTDLGPVLRRASQEFEFRKRLLKAAIHW